MSKSRRSPKFQTAPPLDTAYRRGQDLWDSRMGSALSQARTWRLTSFAVLLLAGGLCLAVALLATRPAAVPFVIEANTNGETRLVGPASSTYEPSDAQLSWHLARFVEMVRGLPSDAVIVRQNWLRAYDWTTQAGAQTLTAMAEANDPFKDVGKLTISVDVISVIRSSPASFQLRWRESTYTQGVLTDVARYTGIATIVIDPPSTPERLRKNPLGLYVHSFTWSRDLEP